MMHSPHLTTASPMPAKLAKASHVEMTEIVLPNDTNQLGNLLGGRLMHWVDIAAALSAQRHSGRICVTASIDEMSFLGPVKLGQVVRLRACVNRAFHTSMEVGVRAIVEDFRTGDTRHVSSAYLTFVAIDEIGHAVPVPAIEAQSEDEMRRFLAAEERREQRLRKRKELVAREQNERNSDR
ncbi:MAG: acyl-CoA thioesterase [Bacteroidota bacterium]|nr:acyl-CoA thioesterase [Bacteroidota bacterium]MDP4234392.1 acyl-CoA thioesterase [Bacteroidota bacterium]MDP4243325.1 acyl-CoA thioesterase [Bacteroidota bacterium]MDP4288010.1 acyl-CoA thioesterase [Bacteroidota bacterium]